MRKLNIEDFHAELKAQGVAGRDDLAFVCPMCKSVQSARDLIRAGAGASFDEVEKFLAFSCFGRFTGAGPFTNASKPGEGCDWTLGGLFSIHELEVVTPDGKSHPRFEIAAPDRAREHASRFVAESVDA